LKSIIRALCWSAALGLIAVGGGIGLLFPRKSGETGGSRTIYLTEAIFGESVSSFLGSCVGILIVVVCAAIAPFLAYIAIGNLLSRNLTRQRIALTSKGVIVPVRKGFYGATEMLIEYPRIRSIDFQFDAHTKQHVAQIEYDELRRFLLEESFLSSSQHFE